MKSKPAELSSGLVAVKGTATPSADMPGRGVVVPALAAVPPAAVPAAPRRAVPPRVAAAKSPVREAAPEPEKEPNLTPLNFRIPASFRREFRTYAATHDLKLNELLRLCFEGYRKQNRD
jgi:hypothetical protein